MARILAHTKRALRFEYIAFTLAFPVLGAVSTRSQIDWIEVIGLVAVAFFFHAHAALANDVLDLGIDRTNPLRAESPLILGVLKRRPSLILACLFFLLAIALAVWQGATVSANIALIAAFSLIAIYNFFGKRSFALVCDVVIGSAAGSLVLYGAAITDGFSALSFVSFALATSLIVLANIFGSLRDLANDFRHQAVTTPIFLGARTVNLRFDIPRSLIGYMYLVLTLFYSVIVAALLYNWFGYSVLVKISLLVLTILSGIVAMVTLASLFRTARRNKDLSMAHAPVILALEAATIIAVFAPLLSLPAAVCIAVLFMGSLTHWIPVQSLHILRNTIS